MSKHADFLFGTAVNAALESKYDGTKVGCILVDDGRVVSTGWNGYPTGADDKFINEKMDRIDRLKLVIHAEENAILNAAYFGRSAKGSTAYVTHKPCTSCLAKLNNAGVEKVYYISNPGFEAVWCNDHQNVYKEIPLVDKVYPYELNSFKNKKRMIESYQTLDRYQNWDEDYFS